MANILEIAILRYAFYCFAIHSRCKAIVFGFHIDAITPNEVIGDLSSAILLKMTVIPDIRKKVAEIAELGVTMPLLSFVNEAMNNEKSDL